MRSAVVALAAALAIAGLSGCSDDESDALSKEEFISQGDAICAQLDDDAEALEAPEDEAAFGGYLTELAELARGAREEFAALAPPEDGVEVQQDFLEAIDTSVATIEGAAEAADDGDTVTAGDLATQAAEEGSAADEQVQAYGFQECGQSAA
jgi:hypothetical protein